MEEQIKSAVFGKIDALDQAAQNYLTRFVLFRFMVSYGCTPFKALTYHISVIRFHVGNEERSSYENC